MSYRKKPEAPTERNQLMPPEAIFCQTSGGFIHAIDAYITWGKVFCKHKFGFRERFFTSDAVTKITET